jgi:acetylornithine deacetylase/succinyl-diaminopimelate desuccinylase-like protein
VTSHARPGSGGIDPGIVASHVDTAWDSSILPALHDYIRIPNVSPAYDPGWEEAGHMARAVDLVRRWCDEQVAGGLSGATVEVHELPGRTPLLLVDIPPAGDHGTSVGTDAGAADTVLIYGHVDKQPPFDGWRPGLGPWEPVVDGERLYGRGAADDGYAAFAALSAVQAVQAAGGSHTRCLVLIEASEESGSPDLPDHLAVLDASDRLGTPSLVIALDSSCGDWDHLWVTTSLRGLVDATVEVEMLTQGVHSGTAGGVVPSTFRILRMLLDRVEDPASGRLLLPELHVEVPEMRARQAATTAAQLGDLAAHYPLVEGAHPQHPTTEELLLARTWRASLEVTGLDGAPPPASAGNVLRPSTSAKLSLRVPPTADARAASSALVERLRSDPPYGARVTVTPGAAESGWHAPLEPPWLSDALHTASTATFGPPPQAMGEGGTIPFMGMLGRRFPEARFVVTGVLGPESNAHGPNEFLHLPTARRVTAAVAHVLHAHATRSSTGDTGDG